MRSGIQLTICIFLVSPVQSPRNATKAFAKCLHQALASSIGATCFPLTYISLRCVSDADRVRQSKESNLYVFFSLKYSQPHGILADCRNDCNVEEGLKLKRPHDTTLCVCVSQERTSWALGFLCLLALGSAGLSTQTLRRGPKARS